MIDFISFCGIWTPLNLDTQAHRPYTQCAHECEAVADDWIASSLCFRYPHLSSRSVVSLFFLRKFWFSSNFNSDIPFKSRKILQQNETKRRKTNKIWLASCLRTKRRRSFYWNRMQIHLRDMWTQAMCGCECACVCVYVPVCLHVCDGTQALTAAAASAAAATDWEHWTSQPSDLKMYKNIICVWNRARAFIRCCRFFCSSSSFSPSSPSSSTSSSSSFSFLFTLFSCTLRTTAKWSTNERATPTEK